LHNDIFSPLLLLCTPLPAAVAVELLAPPPPRFLLKAFASHTHTRTQKLTLCPLKPLCSA